MNNQNQCEKEDLKITGFWVTIVNKRGEEYLCPIGIEYISTFGENKLYEIIQKTIAK